MDFIDISVVALVVGIILVSNNYIRSNPDQILMISSILAIFYFFLPKNWVVNFIFKIHQERTSSFSNDSNEAINVKK